jgi:hypothetical protein
MGWMNMEFSFTPGRGKSFCLESNGGDAEA